MRKLLSILLSIIFFLSTFHFTLSMHYCGGAVAAVKLSLSSTNATCGMEKDNLLIKNGYHNNCCKNKVTSLFITENFTSGSYANPYFITLFAGLIHLPFGISFYSVESFQKDSGNIYPPPGRYISSNHLQEDICIFRV